jgi:hypothetical protein
MNRQWETHIIHCSDTIQSSKDINKNDTTGDRIKLWYDKIIKKLDIKVWNEVQLIGSTFWNSFETAAQALCMLEKFWEDASTQVVLVNNASRAKHENSKESKGSDCLWAQIEVNGVLHHIVWVDDEAFFFLRPYMKKGTKIKKIASLKQGCFPWIQWIPDLSKWTQFRSKEYFILVQLIFIKHLQEKWEVGKDIEQYFEIEKYDWISCLEHWFRNKLLLILNISDDFSTFELIQKFKEKVSLDMDRVIKKGWVIEDYEKQYIEWFKWIEKVQLLWEWEILQKKVWVFCDFTHLPLGVLDKYNTFRSELWENQIGLIDRDKFWNGKFIYNDSMYSFSDFVEENGLKIWDKVKVNWENWELFECFLVNTISDRTWEVCIWPGSSRWPRGENFIELNKSFGSKWSQDDNEKQLLDGIPIWTILTLA